MLILGLILLVVGYFLGIHLLYVVGGILALVGLILWVAPAIGLNGGRPVGGRRWY